MALTPPESLTGLGRLENYLVLGVIGGGGMGYVLRARNESSGEEVAIKLLRPELVHNRVAVHRFLREARHMKSLDHPHIVRPIEVVPREEGPYFVMERFTGGSLADRLSRGGAMQPAEVLQIACAVGSAIAYAHGKGLVHRDIKPGNVLLDDEGRVRLTDFGLARSLFNDTLVDVELDQAAGTLPYMSPGALKGVAEDTRTDVYAFGCLLYEMLTGQPPFRGETCREVKQRILSGPPEPVVRLKPDLDPAWAIVVEGAMAPDLRHRYASMADAVEDLERLQRREHPLGPGSPAAPAWTATLTKLTDNLRRIRHRWSTAALSLAVGVVGYVALSDRSPHARLLQHRVFSVPGLYQLHRAQVINWPGMRRPLLCLAQDDSVYHVSLQGSVVANFHLADALAEQARLGCVLPESPTEPQQVIVSWRGGTHLHAAALDFFGTEWQRFATTETAGANPDLDARQPSLLLVHQATDLDGDGHEEILATLEAASAGSSNAVLCFDSGTGALLWQHPCPTRVGQIEVLDLDHDGRREILVGFRAAGATGSLGNAPALAVLDAAGTERWTWSPGAATSSILLVRSDAELDHDTLIAAVNHPKERLPTTPTAPHATLVRLNAAGAVINQRSLNAPVLSLLTGDMYPDGRHELLVTDADGDLQVFDEALEPLRAASLARMDRDHPDFRLKSTADLDEDGLSEILLECSREEIMQTGRGTSAGDLAHLSTRREPTLVILNGNLELLARHQLAEIDYQDSAASSQVVVADLDPEPGKEILYLLREKAYVLGYDAGR